jgi:hypothetical protein
LDDGVLAAPADFIKMANPAGEVVADCAPAGPGWFISGAELLSLGTSNPAEVRAGLAVCLIACAFACQPTTYIALLRNSLHSFSPAGAA